MKKNEITLGGHYTARISGRFVTVRVDEIRERFDHKDRSITVYDVTNLSTGRKTTFRSAAKFRCKAGATKELIEAKDKLLAAAANMTAETGLDSGEKIRRSEQADEEAERVENKLLEYGV